MGFDCVLVQNSEDSQEYHLLQNYLNNIENMAERNIEETQIKKAVGWYD